MGSMNKGSFKLNKVATRSRMNNSSYNTNSASKFGNTNVNFKNGFRTPATNTKVNVEVPQNEENK
jgi:hypothetical protein